MPENPVVHLHLPVDARTGKLLDEYGDIVRRPRGFPGIDYRTTVVFAVEFLDRELAPDLSWNLAAHPLDAETVYALSGGCDRSADASPMFLCDAEKVNLPGDWPDGSDPGPARGRLTFRVTLGDGYFAAIAGNDTLRKFCSMTVTMNSGSDSAVVARIPFRPRKRADESAGGSSGGSGTSTTVNGLSGAVVLAGADGNPLPADGQTIIINAGSGGSGLTIIADPIAQIPVIDPTWGYCRYLDATFTRIAFVGRIRNLRRVRMEVVSANPAVTGTVEITPEVSGVDGAPFTIEVGATPAEVVFALAMNAGTLALRRTGGTLADGGMVTCIVLDIVFEVLYAD